MFVYHRLKVEEKKGI